MDLPDNIKYTEDHEWVDINDDISTISNAFSLQKMLYELNELPKCEDLKYLDKSILNQKGTPPLLNELERAILVSAIESVDRVVIFNEKDASDLIRKIRPVTIVKREHFLNKNLPEKKAIEEIGAKIKFFQKF